MEKRSAEEKDWCPAEAVGRKRPRVVAGEEPEAAEMSDVYRSREFLGRIAKHWRNKEVMKNDDSGAVLYNLPYQLCILPSFITGGNGHFLLQLREELLRLKFAEKNNDLYQFRQSADLRQFKSPCITAFRSVLHEQCLPWLGQVTGVELNTEIDITASKYEFTDYLLCHDDQLEGRRIAFIFYLVPEWTATDGGNLELFDTDERGQPREVVVSLSPVWNNFVFFEVTPASYHQVSEVLQTMKTRLSISGWFHGPPVPRPHPKPLPPPPMSPPIPADLAVLTDWVNPVYLDIGTQSQVQSQFEVDSQIELPDFLLETRYEDVCGELGNQQCCKWTVKGPPNKRHVHVAEEGSLPPASAALLSLLRSEPFCRLLSHLTGLDLALNLIRPDAHGEDCDQPCSSSSVIGTRNGVDGRESGNGHGVGSACWRLPQSSSHREDADRSTSSGAVSGRSGHQSAGDGAATESSRPDSQTAAEVKGELQQLRPGDYSLVSDQDPSIGETELHLLLHLRCRRWSGDSGGMRVYVARDEDEELLTVSPSGNALSLVFCDQDTISFTKYLNHRTDSPDSSFFRASFTYRETQT